MTRFLYHCLIRKSWKNIDLGVFVGFITNHLLDYNSLSIRIKKLIKELLLTYAMKKILTVFLVLFLIGCSAPDVVEEESTAMKEGTLVTVETNKGSFTILLYEDTPITTSNFIKLAESGFYDGLTFHRYEPGFVIQGGDPNGDGTGGSEETIALEVVGKSHRRGTVGMARSADPDSASSQWFINLADNSFLDDGYAVFGEVTDGMDVVDSLRAGDMMKSVNVQA